MGLIEQRLLNGKGKLFVEHPSKEARKLHKMIGSFGGYWIYRYARGLYKLENYTF
jgi:hypothetical protein